MRTKMPHKTGTITLAMITLCISASIVHASEKDHIPTQQLANMSINSTSNDEKAPRQFSPQETESMLNHFVAFQTPNNAGSHRLVASCPSNGPTIEVYGIKDKKLVLIGCVCLCENNRQQAKEKQHND